MQVNFFLLPYLSQKEPTDSSKLGAFGSGAAFALQDGWILARAIEYCRSSPQPIKGALQIFEAIRSPYYHRLFVETLPALISRFHQLIDLCVRSRYDHLDQQAKDVQDAETKTSGQSFAAKLKARTIAIGGAEKLTWIHENDIEEVWKEFVIAQIQNLRL